MVADLLLPLGNSMIRINPSMKLEEVNKIHIQNTLHFYKGNIDQAAKALGVCRATIYRKLKRYK